MSLDKTTIPAPTIVDREFVKPLLCGAGPSDVWPSVVKAYSKPVLSPICDEQFKVLDDIRAGLQYVFQTNSNLVLAMSGSAHTGMEALISNLIAPNEILLVASRGIWDQRAADMASRYGIRTIVSKITLNKTFSLEQLEALLTKHKPHALFITHGDSSTGTIQNLEGLGQICHKYGTLLLVDTVVSLIGAPFFMDKWEIDAVYTSTQKAMSGPAGISPVAFSPRAEAKINNRKHKPPFYFDITLLAQQWNCYGDTRSYHHTLSPPLLWALRECLKEVIKETLPVSWARHTATTAHFHRRLKELPLQFLVPKLEDRLVTVTTIVLPKGYDHKKFVSHLREKHHIMILAGLGPTIGIAVRVGLMGVNSTITNADIVADALTKTLKALTKSSL
ncbi:hypothetical protein K1T71_007809 [Dendrolimus kikuchii]|uniref:Uncharacterized protein n=1 Tax=Dendrolimus kikuchii TaxID=765133 RepID=A0ACC1CYS4_9NEOP|nr:hypothetical protein K1T71_007809 [Dendrolimus kikuchii]